MNERRIPIINEEPKYKKKSTNKGLPRSKHKHKYKTVLLSRNYKYKNFQNGTLLEQPITSITRVCTVCGRIGYNDTDPSYYDIVLVNDGLYPYKKKVLSSKALRLQKWYTNDYFDKFAHKCESD